MIRNILSKLKKNNKTKLTKKEVYVFSGQICNLSKIPISVEDNILYKMSEVCKCEPNRQTAWEVCKAIFVNLTNLADIKLDVFYHSNSSALAQHRSDSVFLPWIHYQPTQFNDSFFKIFYDEKYQHVQFNKIFNLVQSIKENGYKPDFFPTRQQGISGYFLVKNEKKRFYVVSGNHRVAVLSSLFPIKKIPVVLEDLSTAKERDIQGTIFEKKIEHPNIFSIQDVRDWPSVKSGFIDEKTAKSIFFSYYNGNI